MKISETKTNSGRSEAKTARKKRAPNEGQPERKRRTKILLGYIKNLSPTKNSRELENKLTDKLDLDQATAIFGKNWGKGINFRRFANGEFAMSEDHLKIVASAAVRAGLFPKGKQTQKFFADFFHPERFASVLKFRDEADLALSDLRKAASRLEKIISAKNCPVYIDNTIGTEQRTELIDHIRHKARKAPLLNKLKKFGLDVEDSTFSEVRESINRDFVTRKYDDCLAKKPELANFDVKALIAQLSTINLLIYPKFSRSKLPSVESKLPTISYDPTSSNKALSDPTDEEFEKLMKSFQSHKTGTKLAQRKAKTK